MHGIAKGFTSRLNSKLSPLFNVKSFKVALRGPDPVDKISSLESENHQDRYNRFKYENIPDIF